MLEFNSFNLSRKTLLVPLIGNLSESSYAQLTNPPPWTAYCNFYHEEVDLMTNDASKIKWGLRGEAIISLCLAVVLEDHITEEVVFELDFEERIGRI